MSSEEGDRSVVSRVAVDRHAQLQWQQVIWGD